MKSFSFEVDEPIGDNWFEVWREIEKNKRYFLKYCGDDADEAMQRVLIHTLTHYNPDKGSLKYYILALAKNILRRNNKICFVDFLEQTVQEDMEEVNISGSNKNKGVMSENVSDFADDLVNDIYLSEDRYSDVAELALLQMDMFLMLCDALINRDSSTRYYSDSFIKSCLKISKKCNNFNELCLRIYYEYNIEMKDFLSKDMDKYGTWKEADFVYIGKRTSKRVILVDNYGNTITDADKEYFSIKGNISGKKIVKVGYNSIYEKILSLVDSDNTNCMKFFIGNQYIVRTLGGSHSIINPPLYNIYDLVLAEIVTNLLRDIDGILLCVGSENLYCLCNENKNIAIPDRRVRGIDLHFNYEVVDL